MPQAKPPKVNPKSRISSGGSRRQSRPKSPVERGQAIYDDITTEVISDLEENVYPQFELMVMAVEQALEIRRDEQGNINNQDGLLPRDRILLTIKNLKTRDGDKVKSEVKKEVETNRTKRSRPS